ncbi:hypothetical protein [Aeromicrobium ginsengisoli]|uniref:SnoaL-like domain-containing protein n=1 Tax=Aeromicrobium ginsengisoli TaxID=363867 RepID=A0A5M4F965_9ACTN|nr:hypothetical protein [Aeromicrobium ginsengisoli]KAA1394248.1 hypothetical protein ESP70_018775 [Aeromicrobium ginsengisoli]
MQRTGVTADLEGFDQVYRHHVDRVVDGDLPAVLSDMADGSVPQVFVGVETPRGAVDGFDIRSVSLDGDRAVGECVYTTAGASIGLRSGWSHDGSTWKADRLENFQP